MDSPSRKPPLWREVLSLGFLGNLVIGIVATCWIPLAKLTILQDGVPVGSRYLPMYEMYAALWRNPAGMRSWRYVGLHWLLVGSVTLAVWLGVAYLRRRREAKDGRTGS